MQYFPNIIYFYIISNKSKKKNIYMKYIHLSPANENSNIFHPFLDLTLSIPRAAV